MVDSQFRIVSLIPSATEIVAALGLTDCIVGRSHECDYPAAIKNRPVCTAPKFNPKGTSREIHERVTELLQSVLSVYEIRLDVLQQLRPTHILTQAQCDVCAVNLADVEQAVAQLVESQPQVISLQPNTLADVWSDIQTAARTFGMSEEAALTPLKLRVQACEQKTQALPDYRRPTVACIEWTDPLMMAGNWIPELVQLAGGNPLFAQVGQHSAWLDWEALVEADPAVLIFMPCGFNLEQTREAAKPLTRRPEWEHLRAVQSGQVYITDGNQYFNRPGPRLVDSLEILAEILHPGLFRFGYEETGWEQWSV